MTGTAGENLPPENTNFSLETAIARIKHIGQLLQDGQLTFDQSLQLFEEADTLIRQSQEYLQRAEIRLRILGEG